MLVEIVGLETDSNLSFEILAWTILKVNFANQHVPCESISENLDKTLAEMISFSLVLSLSMGKFSFNYIDGEYISGNWKVK